MKKIIFACVLLLLSAVNLSGQACVFTSDTVPPVVKVNDTHHFAANCFGGTPVFSRNFTGTCAGTIDSATGIYTAATSCAPKGNALGCPQGPKNNVNNVAVNLLPVLVKPWLDRIAQQPLAAPLPGGGAPYWLFHHLNSDGTFPSQWAYTDNPGNNTTPTYLAHSHYGGPWDGTAIPWALPPSVQNQNGYSIDFRAANGNFDTYQFVTNIQNCDEFETYAPRPGFSSSTLVAGNPTVVNFTQNTVRTLTNPLRVWVTGASGTCTALNTTWQATLVSPTQATIPYNSSILGCSLSGAHIEGSSDGVQQNNMASVGKWPGNSNAIIYGANASGASVSRGVVHVENLWNVVTNNVLDPACSCVTLGHALEISMNNQAIAPADVWPSIQGHDVTGPHPRMLPVLAVNGSPTSFSIPTNDCNDPYSGAPESFMQCQRPMTDWTFTVGGTFSIVFGSNSDTPTGPWTALLGSCTNSACSGNSYTATATGNSSYTIPVDSSVWGAMPSWLVWWFDWAPYGTRFRIKSTFDVTTVCNDSSQQCKLEQAILNTLKIYGFILRDGGTNWAYDFGVGSGFSPDEVNAAIAALNASCVLGGGGCGGFESILEIVDESSLQVSTDPNYLGQTAKDDISVSVTAAGHGSATLDLIQAPTTVGCWLDHIVIPALAGNSYQVNCWVNGNTNQALTYSWSPAVTGATLSGSGLLSVTAPASITALTQTVVKVCSANPGDTTVCQYVSAQFVPVSSDGGIRLWVGGSGTPSTSYLDHTVLCSGGRCTWWGQVADRVWDTSFQTAANTGHTLGTYTHSSSSWSGTVDAPLYGDALQGMNDFILTLAVPANVPYNVQLNGESGYGCGTTGCNVFDIELCGNVAASFLDGYSLAGGQYRPWTWTGSCTASGGLLTVAARVRENGGLAIGSVKISTALPTCAITISGTLPDGTLGVGYSATLTATDNGHCTLPLIFTASRGCLGAACSGNEIAGLGMSSGGVYDAGSPTQVGTGGLTVQACDSAVPTPTCQSKLYIIRIAGTPPAATQGFSGMTDYGIRVP